MFGFSQISRIMIPILQLLNMIETNSAIAVPHIFNILKDILSGPWALSSFNDLIILMSFLSNLIKESLVIAKFGFQEFYCYYLKVYIESQKWFAFTT